MLAVGVENDHKIDIALQEMTQPGFDRLAFAAVLFVNDYFRAGRARIVGSFIDRPVINNKNVVELLARSTNNVADVSLFVVSGNDRRDLRHLADNRMKIGRVIRTAHKRTGCKMLKSLFASDLAVKIELLR